jgi:mono/diheme cytochrome c family protein
VAGVGYPVAVFSARSAPKTLALVVLAPLGLVLLATVALAQRPAKTPSDASPRLIERGRYLVKIAGCNDCHTPGYAERAGDVPEERWLVGDTLGWRGPWGTTYAANLRLYLNGMTEAQWLAAARALRSRPPMPWFALRDMADEDLRAIYRYVRSLGPAGTPAPAFVPPDRTPAPPYVQFPAPPAPEPAPKAK